MDKQNKDFQFNMKKENNTHTENLERIGNERQLMNLQHQCNMAQIVFDYQLKKSETEQSMKQSNNAHEEKNAKFNIKS